MREARAEIESMLGSGKSFGQVENFIDLTGLNEDQKSALWLYAESQGRDSEQRNLARRVLSMVEERGD